MPKHRNDKRERFCQEYIIDLNGTQAAIRAGFAPRNASSTAYKLLRDPEVSARIQELNAQRSLRTEISADRVLQELAVVGFANITNYMQLDEDGQPFMDLTETTNHQMAAVSELQSEVTFEVVQRAKQKTAKSKEVPEIKVGVRSTKLKFHSKTIALTKLGEHLNIFDKADAGALDPLVEALKQIATRGSTAPVADPAKATG